MIFVRENGSWRNIHHVFTHARIPGTGYGSTWKKINDVYVYHSGANRKVWGIGNGVTGYLYFWGSAIEFGIDGAGGGDNNFLQTHKRPKVTNAPYVSGNDWVDVAAGPDNGAGIRNTNTNIGVVQSQRSFCYTWGDGVYGALGHNPSQFFTKTGSPVNYYQRSTPVIVQEIDTGPNNWHSVQVGYRYMLALASPLREGHTANEFYNSWHYALTGYYESDAHTHIRCWGYDLLGMLGTNGYSRSLAGDTTYPYDFPSNVSAYRPTVVSIPYPGNTKYYYGEILNEPTSYGSFTFSVAAFSAGAFHAGAITKLGTWRGYSQTVATKNLWMWGWNGHGNLGDGYWDPTNSTTASVKFTPINFFDSTYNVTGVPRTWKQIACGRQMTAAIAQDGSLWTWGTDTSGALGSGQFVHSYPATTLAGGNDWSSVSVSKGDKTLAWDDIADYNVNHSISAIKTDGTLYTWGSNAYDQLGRQTGIRTPVTTEIGGNDWKLADPSTPSLRTCSNGGYGDGSYDFSGVNAAIKNNGRIYTWGGLELGGLGHLTDSNFVYDGGIGDENTEEISATPRQMVFFGNYDWISVKTSPPFGAGVVNVDGGVGVAMKNDGTLWAWGGRDNLHIGANYVNPYRLTPSYMLSGETYDYVYFTPDDTTYLKRPFSESIERTSSIVDYNDYLPTICSTGSRTAFINKNGSLVITGDNSSRLCTSITSYQDKGTWTGPWKTVHIYDDRNAAIKSDGTMWMWGTQSSGQFGNNSTASSSTPVPAAGGLAEWKQVEVDFGTTMGIKMDGTWWIWGQNLFNMGGYFGTRSNPVQIQTGNDWKQFSMGNQHANAIKTDGTLWGIGVETYAGVTQTSNLTTNNTPVYISSGWKEVSVQGYSTIGLKSDGTLWSWGQNDYGSLGLGYASQTDVTVPTQIGTSNDWRNLCRNNNTFVREATFGAIKNDGSLWMWGAETKFGELGNNTYGAKTSPNSRDPSFSNTTTPVPIYNGGTGWEQVSIGKGDFTETGVVIGSKVSTEYSALLALENGNSITAPQATDTVTTPFLFAWGGIDAWDQLSQHRNSESNFFRIDAPGEYKTIWKDYDIGPHAGAGIRKSDGKMFMWGWNEDGVLGIENGFLTTAAQELSVPDVKVKRVPTTIGNGIDSYSWLQVSIGHRTTSAIREVPNAKNQLWAWGGLGNQYNRGFTWTPTLLSVDSLTTPLFCSSGYENGIMWIGARGGVNYANYYNGYYYHDSGIGLRLNERFQENVVAISINPGTDHQPLAGQSTGTVGIIYSDGTLRAEKGVNQYGESGTNEFYYAYNYTTNRWISVSKTGSAAAYSAAFVQVDPDGAKWNQIHYGTYGSIGIRTDGTLWTWGRDDQAQLGINRNRFTSRPVSSGNGDHMPGPVTHRLNLAFTPNLFGFTPMTYGWASSSSAHRHHSAIGRDGKVYSWGYGLYAGAGISGADNITYPTQIAGDPDFSVTDNYLKVASGPEINFAIESNTSTSPLLYNDQNTYTI